LVHFGRQRSPDRQSGAGERAVDQREQRRAHLAEDYDRDLTDVFAIQTDLAQKIATSLQAKLSPNEKERLDQRPTENSDAYLLFLQAHDYASRMDLFHKSSAKAVPLFEQAIKLDPTFALAFAGLSMAESWLYHSSDPVPARREKARLHADEALRLQPDLPEGHLALGFSYYYGDRDYDRALTEFEIARRGLPNDAQAYLAIGAIQRRQGKWAESTANLEKAAALDPKNESILMNLAYSYMALRNFEAADKTVDRAIAAAPKLIRDGCVQRICGGCMERRSQHGRQTIFCHSKRHRSEWSDHLGARGCAPMATQVSRSSCCPAKIPR